MPQASGAAASIPQEYLLGGAAVVALLAIVALTARQSSGAGAEDGGGTQSVSRGGGIPRKDAVLVIGASNRVGRRVVRALLDAGRCVVAAPRAGESMVDAMKEVGAREGRQATGGGVLFVERKVDLTKAETLTKDIFRGATQVVLAVTNDSAPGGGAALNSEAVDGAGVAAAAAAAAAALPRPVAVRDPLVTPEGLAAWKPLDDVIMGGSSSSAIAATEVEGEVEWAGDVVVEGGGFAGLTSPDTQENLAAYDGIALRVLGDGSTFKLNLRTGTQSDGKDTAYQAVIDTEAGEWTTVRLPWSAFVPVQRARYAPDLGPLDPSNVTSFGLVYSRFAFDGAPNANFKPGKFSLKIAGGLTAYAAPRPSIALLTSAATERNARIGADAGLRAADIPIVQLNPQGTLNWMYKGEAAVRACGLPYTVIRPAGLVAEDNEAERENGYTIELDQGDRLSGRIGRDEVAQIVAAALATPMATNATFEARRTTRRALGGVERATDGAWRAEFLSLVPDRQRARIGLPPLPAPVDPPPPVTEERKKEILADPRVVASMPKSSEGKAAEAARFQKGPPAEQGATMPAAQPQAATNASLVLRRAAVQAWISGWRERTAAADGSAPAVASNGAAATPEAAKEAVAAAAGDAGAAAAGAQAWVANWRGKAQGAARNGAHGSDGGASAGSPSGAQSARSWIEAWRSRN